MISLKLFLDSLVEEDHPFRKGPDLRDGSALPAEEVRVRAGLSRSWAHTWEEKLVRFRYMRINKN
jgi:hypothetical protein